MLEQKTKPIGVFDSGVGGLTVLRALRARLPNERFVYLGDTARLPYGTKSQDSVVRYSTLAARKLVEHDIKCLVIACNTASALALEALRQEFRSLPVVGVIESGADAACAASQSKSIVVIATESTVRNGAYERAIRKRQRDTKIISRACPLFVSLAEEGWTSGPIVEAIAHRYLDDIFASANKDRPDTLVLGCTHFPVLAPTLQHIVGSNVAIVDSAQTTAAALENILKSADLFAANGSAALTLLATDGCERFARVGSIFLGHAIQTSEVQLVDL